ncbi:hypothetical protein NIIDMKKI_02940 [Mycobacterium kansasii]|uniref:Acyl-CoA dehydrogenase/oxidase C-terminal domain-containing protein n=1 Tax=Mycobacterium kansasii TaxID=1768 RepID=A0A7G1I9B3_MYCKA|nr:hypothetical protein NIIDMKKI_02940 [Mycobacterium kansasii]
MFFDDARTDAGMVVGRPGDGWRVAMATLTFERGVSTLGQQIVYARELSRLVELAQRTGAADDPFIRERLTRAWTGLRAMRSYALATLEAPAVEQPGPDNVSKLLWANWHRSLGELAMDVVGKPGLALTDGEFDEWQRLYLFTRADTIYGGSNEIQRNIIAERVLGLPRRSRDEFIRRAERDSRTWTFGRQSGGGDRGCGYRHRLGHRAPRACRGPTW